MTDEKAFQRSVRAVWDEIRKERRAGRRNVASADLTATAARMRDFAERFDTLAVEAKQAETASSPPEATVGDEAKSKRKPKPKAKKAATAKSAKKAKKKKT